MTLITVKEAAELVNRHPDTVYDWISSGRLRRYQDGNGVTLVNGREILDLEPKVRRGRPKGTTRHTAM